VNPTTLSHLLDLNRQFYQTFASAFSSTRLRLQPGVLRILKQISSTDNLLDLGCGNGALARQLASRGLNGTYTGLDFSQALLEQASAQLPPNFRFLQADLASPDWEVLLAGSQFDTVLAFAVLHHLPGEDLRLQVLNKVRTLLLPGGRYIHSEWQFLNSPRLTARIQPWEAVGLSAREVEPGDYLLDWRQGGQGLRYVHHFSEPELALLASDAGFEVTGSFLSDGENHRLGLYQVWREVD
jgi:tRNA (uracil-5-)-methyltransferase TRM9